MSELISASEASRNARRYRRILEDMFPFLRQSGVLAQDQAPEAAGEKVEALRMKIEAALTAANVDERTRFAVKHLVDELVDHVGEKAEEQSPEGTPEASDDAEGGSLHAFLAAKGMSPEDIAHAMSLAGAGAGGDEGAAPPDPPGGGKPLIGGGMTPVKRPPNMRTPAMDAAARIAVDAYGRQPERQLAPAPSADLVKRLPHLGRIKDLGDSGILR